MASILLVDDISMVRSVLRRMLERDGHQVVEASDGADALGRLDQGAFDLLITDIWMPELDGISLIGRARASRPGLKVIAVSGGAPRAPQDFTIAEASAAGADEVLLKPVDRAEISAAVGRLLAR